MCPYSTFPRYWSFVASSCTTSGTWISCPLQMKSWIFWSLISSDMRYIRKASNTMKIFTFRSVSSWSILWYHSSMIKVYASTFGGPTWAIFSTMWGLWLKKHLRSLRAIVTWNPTFKCSSRTWSYSWNWSSIKSTKMTEISKERRNPSSAMLSILRLSSLTSWR